MAGKSDAWETALLGLLFNGTAVANIADNAASSPLTNLYVSLHSADPTDAGNQSTNEISYTSYARVAVARNGTGWVVTGNVVNPAATISFPACTGGTATATHFGIGKSSSGAGTLLYSGPLAVNIAVSTSVVPQLTTATSVTED